MPTTTPSSSFWSRLFGRRESAEEALRTPVIPGEIEPVPIETPEPAERSSGPLARWSRRDQAIVQLQEGYEKVTKVIEEIQKHLVQQGERSERLCGTLEKIAQSMCDGPQVARQQAATLERIATQMENSSARTHQIAELVAELPKSARAQTDTLVSIGRQLEVSNEQRLVASQAMDRLGTGLQTLGESSQAQGEILKQMSAATAEQNRQLGQLIAEQSKRFQYLFIVTVVIAVLAIGAAVMGLMMRQ